VTTAARRRPRAGFTLLEVLLASAIAVFLLGALYVAFDMTLRQTDAGREAAAHGDLGRAIVNRMSIDLSGCLGQLQPNSGGASTGSQSSGSSSSGTSSTASGTSTTAATASSTATTSTAAMSSTATTGSSSTTTTNSAMSSLAPDFPFQAGVYGSNQQLTLFLSRVPPSLLSNETIAGGTDQQPSDQLRVIYYPSSSGQGLCRQVRQWVTADGVRNSTDPDPGTEQDDLLAEEVTDVQFEYFDGASWQTAWDGSQTQSDGVTLQGPPRAIRVTLTIQPAGAKTTQQIQHVFPIRASIGVTYQPGMAGTGTTTSTTPGTTTTTGGGM